MKRLLLIAVAVVGLALGISYAQVTTSNPSNDSITQLVHWVNEIPMSVNFDNLTNSQAMRLHGVLNGLVSDTAPTPAQAQQALKDIAANLPKQVLQALENKIARSYTADDTVGDINSVWANYQMCLGESIAALDSQFH